MKDVISKAPSVSGVILPPGGPRRRYTKRIYLIAATLLIAGALLIAYVLRPRSGPPIATEPIVRKTLVEVVTATGTINPKQTISVGTQVSGTIQTIVADYNDRVRKGQVLARLDPKLLQASLDQAQGTLAQARAQWQAASANASGAAASQTAAFATADAGIQNSRVVQAALLSADASVVKAQAAMTLARQTLTRDRQLLGAGFIAQSQFDTDSSDQVAAGSALSSAVVAARQARLQVSAARSSATAGSAAAVASASGATAFSNTAAADLAAIDAAAAQVKTATINLKNTVITSPVDGTVIARNVSVGQTVAASFQTPTLYTIAENLNEMEIDLAAGEPDIGAIRVGQPVSFTVLSYPDYVFHETVSQVRYNPTTIQNVVTYDTVLYENNADGRLRPGMTADASIEVARVENALVVSLAALNFHPPQDSARAATSAMPRATSPSVWGNTGAVENATLTAGSHAVVTVVESGRLRSVPVRVMLVSSGEAAIEPLAGSIAVGSQIAIAVATQQATTSRVPSALR